GNVDLLLVAETHMGRNVSGRLRRSCTEVDCSWSPNGDLSRQGCHTCPSLCRIPRLSPTNRHPSKGHGGAKDIIDLIFFLLFLSSVQPEQPINPTQCHWV